MIALSLRAIQGLTDEYELAADLARITAERARRERRPVPDTSHYWEGKAAGLRAALAAIETARSRA